MSIRNLLETGDYICLETKKYHVNGVIGEGATWVGYSVTGLDGTMYCLKEYYPIDYVKYYERNENGCLYVSNKNSDIYQYLIESMAYSICHEKEILDIIYQNREGRLLSEKANSTDCVFMQREIINSTNIAIVTYVISEMSSGKNLQELLGESCCETTEKYLRLLLDIGNAIKVIHKKGILHLDIKPNNIYVSNDMWYVKILDYGSSIIKGKRYSNKEIKYTSLAMYSLSYETAEQQKAYKMILEAREEQKIEKYIAASEYISKLNEECDIYAYVCLCKNMLEKIGLLRLAEELHEVETESIDDVLRIVYSYYRTQLQEIKTAYSIKNISMELYNKKIETKGRIYNNSISPIEFSDSKFLGISDTNTNTQYLFVGEYGTGKTMLLYKVWEWCLYTSDFFVPLYIDCSEMNDIDIEEQIKIYYGFDLKEYCEDKELFFLVDNVPYESITTLSSSLSNNYIFVINKKIPKGEFINNKRIIFDKLTKEQKKKYIEEYISVFSCCSEKTVEYILEKKIHVACHIIMFRIILENNPDKCSENINLYESCFFSEIEREKVKAKQMFLIAAYDYYLPWLAIRLFFHSNVFKYYKTNSTTTNNEGHFDLRKIMDYLAEYGLLEKVEYNNFVLFRFSDVQYRKFFLAKYLVYDYVQNREKAILLSYAVRRDILEICCEIERGLLDDIKEYVGKISPEGIMNLVQIFQLKEKCIDFAEPIFIEKKTWPSILSNKSIIANDCPIYVCSGACGDISIYSKGYKIYFSPETRSIKKEENKFQTKRLEECIWWSKGGVIDGSLDIIMSVVVITIVGYENKDQTKPIYRKKRIEIAILSSVNSGTEYNKIEDTYENNGQLFILVRNNEIFKEKNIENYSIYFLPESDRDMKNIFAYGQEGDFSIFRRAGYFLKKKRYQQLRVGKHLIAVGGTDNIERVKFTNIEIFWKENESHWCYNSGVTDCNNIVNFDVIEIDEGKTALIYLNDAGIYLEYDFACKDRTQYSTGNEESVKRLLIDDKYIKNFCVINHKKDLIIFRQDDSVWSVTMHGEELIYKRILLPTNDIDVCSGKAVSGDDTCIWFRDRSDENRIHIWAVNGKRRYIVDM